MNKYRITKQVAVAAGFIILYTVAALADTPGASPRAAQTPQAASPGAQQRRDALPPDDFSGLNYTDDQKAEIARIHRETESQRDAVVKDQTLTADQKGAMLLGYARMEAGRRFKVLSPEQRRQVRERIVARRNADQAAQKRQPPRK